MRAAGTGVMMKIMGVMRAIACDVCGGREFVAAEYTSEVGRAPAFKCARCGALHLSVDAASSEDERDSIKRAQALREAIRRDPELSGRGRKDPE